MNPTPIANTASHVQLDVSGQRLRVPIGQTLLRSLHAAGVAWPASCRNGTCRSCIGRVEQGQVVHDIEWPGLLPEEKQQGGVLPCVARPLSDVVLRGPGF